MKRCGDCQYFRDGTWCSNSKSGKYRLRRLVDEVCDQFYQSGKKAPMAMRLAIRALQMAKGKN